MDTYKYDLHTHTTTSDGKLNWKELLMYAVEIGLKGISITDHNTLGPVDEIRQEASSLGLRYIPGTEIKVTCKKQIEEYKSQTGSSKILLPLQELIIYGIDPTNKEFLEASKEHLEGKKAYVVELCSLLQQHSISELPNASADIPILIDAENVIRKGGSYVGAARVHDALNEKYRQYSTAGTFTKADIKKLFDTAQAGAMRVMENDPFYGLDIVEGLKKAKTWGKEVVMAHPFTESRKEMTQFYEQFLIPLLAENGLDGLECLYPDHTEEQKECLRGMAAKFNLQLTGGSDFHKKEDKLYKLGRCGVDEAAFLELEERVK